MRGNHKILVIISSMMLSFLIAIVVVLTINFKNFSQEKEFDKAKVIASLVRDGLTAHMASGTMSQRELFLRNAKESSGALDIWIFRTDKVVKLFGKGFDNESIRDNIDKKMIKTKKTQEIISENLIDPTLRVTIPYIATSRGTPDCLKCHTDAKQGDVLGGISMVFNMEEARIDSILTVLKILGISFIFIIFFIYVTDKLLKPYVGALVDIKESLQKASRGDYSSRINIKRDDESTEAFKWLNTLFEKLENTIGAIDKNLALFVADRRKKYSDPLEKSQSVIEDITQIYKFKRTIEQDKSKDIIYQRLIKIFKEQLHVSDLSLYEIDIKNDKRTLIYDDTVEKFCEIADSSTSERCRCYRINSIVTSDDFENICQACVSYKEYLCINYQIDENISLALNIKPENKEELFENKKAIGYIKNYLESARPVLQSKILTEILQRSNQIDGLTNLHNRKYLDVFMETKINSFQNFAVSMIDIDFFKKVNDTYGHDVGDIVLKGLSDIFKSIIGSEDMAFRFGGEEFLIFMPDAKSAQKTIGDIKNAFEARVFNTNGEGISKTLSAGIAYYPKDSSSIWGVIKCSDIALYEAKHSGRNKVILYENVEDIKETKT